MTSRSSRLQFARVPRNLELNERCNLVNLNNLRGLVTFYRSPHNVVSSRTLSVSQSQKAERSFDGTTTID